MQKRKKIFSIICLLITLTLFFGCGSLSKSAMNGDLAGIQSRMQAGEKVNQIDKWGWTPLLWATYYDHYQIVEHLLNNGADPNLKSTNVQGPIPIGSTPLIVASYYGNFNTVKLLLKHDADKNIKNSDGETARDLAKKYDFISVLDLLDKGVTDDNPINTK